MARNIFEGNEPPVSPEEALELGDKLFALLPTLPDGERYELTKLDDDKVAVVILKGDDVVKEYSIPAVPQPLRPTEELQGPEKDRFGRRYHG